MRCSSIVSGSTPSCTAPLPWYRNLAESAIEVAIVGSSGGAENPGGGGGGGGGVVVVLLLHLLPVQTPCALLHLLRLLPLLPLLHLFLAVCATSPLSAVRDGGDEKPAGESPAREM